MGAEDAVAENTLPVHLNRQSTALVIIDLQYASACRRTGFGRWLEQEGRESEGVYRFDRIEQLVVPNAARLLAFFRENDMKRVFVRCGAQMAGCLDLIRHLRPLETAFGNVEGHPEFDILDEVKPELGEPVLTKLSFSAFTSTGIDSLLRNLEVDSLVFAGVSTSQCVDLTARDAADRGYSCVIVADAVAEDRRDFHEATLEQFRRLFGAVMTTNEVLADLTGRLRTPPPDA